MAPQDSQNCGRNFAKRKQSDAEFAGNILRMVIIDTVINTILGRLTLDPAGMHCPSCDDVFVSSYRQDAACFYSQAKNQVFRPAGATRCTDSGQTLQYRRAPGSAWLCKISRQSVQTGGNTAPKISKISTFW